ncbi:hypothetical protein ACFL6U_14600 [Planctomycetota bacterium]
MTSNEKCQISDFVLFLSLSTAMTMSVTTWAEPASDMHVASYKDNATPYPLYAGVFGSYWTLSMVELELLANNFDAYYGNFDIDMQQANTIRSIDPNFQFAKYSGAWDISDYMEAERNHRKEILYYRIGNLGHSIDGSTTHITLSDQYGALLASTAAAGELYSYKEGNILKFVIWLKINNEYVRVESVDGSTVTTTRGFDNTVAAFHSTGTPVLAPVYANPPKPSTQNEIRYRHDPEFIYRWHDLFSHTITQYDKHGGGIWIDIVTGGLNTSRMDGGSTSIDRRWNFRKSQGYTDMDWNVYAGEGIKYIQDLFFEDKGFYPVIWGNNLLYPNSYSSSRLRMLYATPEKPRPMDAFAQENCYGGWSSNGSSGDIFNWRSYSKWQENLQSIMFMGEIKAAAAPLMFDGGADNKHFAELSNLERHRRLLYGYSSYLLAVKVESDDKIYTRIGFTPVVDPTGDGPYLELDPCFLWDIGRPVETFASTDYLEYKISDRKIYMRRFEKGIVMVNPSESAENAIDLIPFGGPFSNPDRYFGLIDEISMTPKTGVILLYLTDEILDYLNDKSPPYPNPATFLEVPTAQNSSSVIMKATPGIDKHSIEYYFDELTGNSGGSDSQWQSDPNYIDDRLLPETVYTYTVRMRDIVGNETTASEPMSVTTPALSEYIIYSDSINRIAQLRAKNGMVSEVSEWAYEGKKAIRFDYNVIDWQERLSLNLYHWGSYRGVDMSKWGKLCLAFKGPQKPGTRDFALLLEDQSGGDSSEISLISGGNATYYLNEINLSSFSGVDLNDIREIHINVRGVNTEVGTFYLDHIYLSEPITSGGRR